MDAGATDGPVETAMFDTPTGLCVLRDGSLVVADSKNHAIRRIAPRAGMMLTASFNCRRNFRCVGLLPAYGDDSCVTSNALCGCVVAGKRGLYVTTLIGGLGPGFVDGDSVHALLSFPACVVVDAHGTLLIADSGNNAIRALHCNGTEDYRCSLCCKGDIV